MSVRRLITGVATTSLVAAVLAAAAPAQADPAFVPDADDIVGSGSDTSMFAMQYIAEGVNGFPGYNASSPSAKLVSWDAKILDAVGAQTNSATITPRAGAPVINRPNGSTEGKNLINGLGNNPAFNFARSSSGLSTAEVSAGLFNFPFAKDTLALATAKVTNAPAAISPDDMVKIYNGTHDDWNDLPGSTTAGPIAPFIQQTGSGTRSFFIAQLQAANKGTPVVLAATVKPTQEHDPTLIQSNINAVAPYSIGRNTVDGTPLSIRGGFSAARALFNVVRQADVGVASITALFGKDGYVCSPAAKPLIEAAGFEQLASSAAGGVCGVPTQASTSNLATTVGDAKIATSTTATATSATAGGVSLTATVSAGAIAPIGLVSFFVDGATTPAATTTISGGKAIASLSNVASGARSVVAKYTPSAKSAFAASDSAAASVSVLAAAKAATRLVEKFKASYPKALVYKAKVLVKETAVGAPTGKIIVKRGKKVVGKATIKAGKAVLKLKMLKKGTNKLIAIYKGDSKFVGSKKKFKIIVK